MKRKWKGKDQTFLYRHKLPVVRLVWIIQNCVMTTYSLQLNLPVFFLFFFSLLGWLISLNCLMVLKRPWINIQFVCRRFLASRLSLQDSCFSNRYIKTEIPPNDFNISFSFSDKNKVGNQSNLLFWTPDFRLFHEPSRRNALIIYKTMSITAAE